jgi:hypothetical protein
MLKFVLPAALSLAACAAYAQSSDHRLSEKRQLALQGKAVGEPRSCITTRQIEDVNAVSDRVILFHLKNGRTYRNDLPDACPQATRSGSAFSYRTTGARLCAIDVVQIAEPASGFAYGGCQLGKFTRYELPKGLHSRSL